ncbi:Hsp20/alpha crystallin family protein [Desulfopila sp. IMCC35008]|uniref:Hsp20/alpha crystallin family protein n=1 Tax=Desulfopila sp. IMCC35008 TaxID=2653858 RepID=UPI0013D5E519|nr:Hsp20/alpha crystallin family protein [Desulfopila sp. IMCC35008]
MKDQKKKKANIVVKNTPYEMSPFREMEHYFDDFFRNPFSLLRHPMWSRAQETANTIVTPVVDIFDDGNEMVVKAEIPGVTKEDLNVDISENSLTISGEKKQEQKIDRQNYHRVECSYGSFSRSFSLPDSVIGDEARASFQEGILEIRIPKSKTSKVKKITIE